MATSTLLKWKYKMALSEILKLGDQRLLEKASPVSREDLPDLIPFIAKMDRLILEFRSRYGRGRAIAAPQIGLMKRIICINTGKPQVLINPVIEDASDEMMEVWDDCMSFPDLFVKLKRHKRISISFLDINLVKHFWNLEDDMSELLQHEYDHLDGILAISKAENVGCFRWSNE
jgi:peptide deformylase